MGYSRSCPRTQAASTRHVSDLTPRSDSRPHQPGLPPKRLSTVGTCSIFVAPCRHNPRQHSTESLFSAQSLPSRPASRSSRKDTDLQPVRPSGLSRRCSLLYSKSAASCSCMGDKNDKVARARRALASARPPPPRGAVLGDAPHPPCPRELGVAWPNTYVGPGKLSSVSGTVRERFCPRPGH